MKGSNVKVTLSTQVFFIDYLTSTSFWGDRKGGRGVGSLWPDMTSFLHGSCPTNQPSFQETKKSAVIYSFLQDDISCLYLMTMTYDLLYGGTFRTSQFWSLAVSRVRNELDDRAGFSHRERGSSALSSCWDNWTNRPRSKLSSTLPSILYKIEHPAFSKSTSVKNTKSRVAGVKKWQNWQQIGRIATGPVSLIASTQSCHKLA